MKHRRSRSEQPLHAQALPRVGAGGACEQATPRLTPAPTSAEARGGITASRLGRICLWYSGKHSSSFFKDKIKLFLIYQNKIPSWPIWRESLLTKPISVVNFQFYPKILFNHGAFLRHYWIVFIHIYTEGYSMYIYRWVFHLVFFFMCAPLYQGSASFIK